MDEIDKMLAELKGLPKKNAIDDTPEERLRVLREFAANRTDYPIGTLLKRNKHGVIRYKFPEDGQAAMLIDKFPQTVLDDGGNLANGVIAVCHCNSNNGRHIVVTYANDLRYFEEVKDETKKT